MVTVTYLSRAGDEHRVAYAVGRSVGGAVQRNRVRRRLRALMAAAVDGPDQPAPGDYLVSAASGAASVGFDELGADLDRALASVGPADDPGGRA